MSASFDVSLAAQEMMALLPHYLEDLGELVSIDSGTWSKAGVDEVGSWLGRRYAEGAGTIEVVPQTVVGDNVIIRVLGRGPRRILLLGHTDTVYPDGTAATRPFHIDDGRAIGPGVSDMKSGDLSILYALRLLASQGYDGFDEIVVIHNSDEEIGSPYSKDLVRREAERADAVLVLEAGRENGNIVSARKGIVSFELGVRGVAAHAGANHERGRSAVRELAHIVVALEALNGTVHGATLNVGRVEGGGAINVVPDSARARFEVRAFEIERMREMIAQVEDVVGSRTVPDTEVSLSSSIDHFPMHRSEATMRLVALAQDVAATLGFSLGHTSSGGASDGNTAAAADRPVLDGLGPVGGRAHSLEEYMRVDSVAPRTAMLAGLIAAICDEGAPAAEPHQSGS